ncbi:MAG TPA: serine/threonine-protein kinase, partial [Ktedonobacteraceae bacterium]|nr:serine/threonine-protein kinase [Ktedonobacteraceae bacterium]
IYDFQISRPPESKSSFAYMVMDYVEGQTLADYIATTSRQGKFPPGEELVRLFTSISQAVDYAHQRGIIHRDLKPANILLDQRNASSQAIPVLTDFGLVKLLGAPAATLSGSWLGTPLYIPPEQAFGFPGNERSDIYALGVILYELCTGVPPFSGDNPVTIIMQHIHAMPTHPALINPAISPALAEVILCSLAKDPVDRFPSASFMAAALAQAINMQVLDGDVTAADQSLSMYPTGDLGAVTHKMSSQTDLSTRVTSSSPAPAALPTRRVPIYRARVAASVSSVPTTPTNGSVGAPGTRKGHHYITAAPPIRNSKNVVAPLAGTLSGGQVSRGAGTRLGLIAIVIIILIGSGLGTFFFLMPTINRGTTVAPRFIVGVGQAFFVSSGQLNDKGIPGINDELQMNLQNISAPAAGKSYYVWLLNDKNQTPMTAILLGTLSVTHGTVHFLYQGDPQHTNLLEVTSRILITEEDASRAPINPSSDFSTWRYYAELPQEPDPNDKVHHFSMLDHVRSLLAEDPMIGGIGIHGGLTFLLLRSTGKVVEWANSARDDRQENATNLMRAHFIRILDTLDGQANVQADVPPGTPLVLPAPIALLGPDIPVVQSQTSADYLHLVSGHLNAIAQASNITPAKRQLAARINVALNDVRTWLEEVRQDAKKLILLTDAQLLSQEALTLLDDMVTQGFYAYV